MRAGAAVGRDRGSAIVFALAAALAVALSLWLVRFPAALPGAGLGAVAVAIAWSDLGAFRIPNLASFATAGLGLCAAVLSGDGAGVQLGLALARGIVAFAAFYLFRDLYKRWRGVQGLGLGDVKLAGVAGLWLDMSGFALCLELACAAALFFLLVRRFVWGEGLDPGRRLPFGAFLAPAIWMVWLWRSASG